MIFFFNYILNTQMNIKKSLSKNASSVLDTFLLWAMGPQSVLANIKNWDWETNLCHLSSCSWCVCVCVTLPGGLSAAPCVCTCNLLIWRHTPFYRSWVWTCTPSSCCPSFLFCLHPSPPSPETHSHADTSGSAAGSYRNRGGWWWQTNNHKWA